VDIIPPASALKETRKVLKEKRVRIKYDPSVKPDSAKLSGDLARVLGIVDRVELVVAGRAKFVLNAIVDEEVEADRVHVNPDFMREEGVSDNSIATIRAYSGSLRVGTITRM
jgi:hypothetical protein